MSTQEVDTIELTGILASTDVNERLRLCLIDYLTPKNGADIIADNSWYRLRKLIPSFNTEDGYNIPYTLPLDGAPDDAGIRGECWITLPGSKKSKSRSVKEHRKRILSLAKDLRGKEVKISMKPKRYSFINSYGETTAGTSLIFNNMILL